jgi:hypothetical protein
MDERLDPTAQRFSKPVPREPEAGKVRPALLLWALGLPIPLVLLFVLLRGCA